MDVGRNLTACCTDMLFYEVSKIRRAWNEISFRRCDFAAGEAYAKVLDAELTNGSVHYLLFKASNVGSLPDLFTYDNWKFSFIHELVWQHPDIAEHLPEIGNLTISDDTFYVSDFFSHVSFLASVLNSGGAYSIPRSSLSQMKSCIDLAFDAIATLMADSDEFCLVLESTHPWCDYFHDVAWDFSAITWSATSHCLGIFVATDTD